MNILGKRLLIFGCGYIGGEAARQAISQGAHVMALTRNSVTAAHLREIGAEVVVDDLAAQTWHAQIAGEFDFVLNAVSSGGGGLEGYRRSYLDGMRSIIRWTQRNPIIGTLVYTSSTAVYPQDGGITVGETSATAGAGERGQILLEAERVLQSGFSGSGACNQGRYFILRLAGIYGPDRHHLVDQVRGGEVSGRPDSRLNLIHRDDVCGAIWAAFLSPAQVRNQILNVADDTPSMKAEVVSWLASELGVAMPTFSGLPAGGRRAVTPDRIISNAWIKTVLGWAPRFADFRQGYKNRLALDGE
jgi:nucleoside-diphosphate-sugar epimerase